MYVDGNHIACLELHRLTPSRVLAGNLPGTEGAYPVVQGSSSIEYLNITDDQRAELASLLSE
jgi:hypothetical protein